MGQYDWLTDHFKLTLGCNKVARWLLLISKVLLVYITNATLSGFSQTPKDQQVAAIKQVNVEFCVLFCLQFITRKVRRKPFNIVTSRQLKPSTSPFQVLVLLSTFNTVIVSLSVIVSSIIRQSFSSMLCRSFVIVYTQRWTDSTPWLSFAQVIKMSPYSYSTLYFISFLLVQDTGGRLDKFLDLLTSDKMQPTVYSSLLNECLRLDYKPVQATANLWQNYIFATFSSGRLKRFSEEMYLCFSPNCILKDQAQDQQELLGISFRAHSLEKKCNNLADMTTSCLPVSFDWLLFDMCSHWYEGRISKEQGLAAGVPSPLLSPPTLHPTFVGINACNAG